MPSPSEKKYIDLIESMFSVLTEGDNSYEALLQPMRIYVNDINRFSTSKIFNSKFRAFVRTRDERGMEHMLKEGVQESPQAGQSQDAINTILDQVLSLLEQGLDSSDNLTVDVNAVMARINKAKTINNIRALSEAFMLAGNEMVSKNQDFQSGLSKLAMELSFSKRQIEDLENQLETSREEAEKDHLTGLRNRRVFDIDFAQFVDRCSRFRSPLCLLLTDIDHFKEINDKYGHPTGDDVLVNFSKVLNQSMREFDLTYRLGGDEFATIFTDSPMKTALQVAERVRSFVASHVYSKGEARLHLSISGGLVQMRPGEDIQALFKRADEQLYRAKKKGRNQICHEANE